VTTDLIVDRDSVVATLTDLVRINSINPGLVPGAPGEAAIAEYVARWLGEAGLEVAIYDAAAGRPSVVGVIRGSGGGRSLMLNAHLDTVGVEGMKAPFSGEVKNGRVYGRGAYDMKGSLTACLTAAAALVRSGGHRGDILIAAVADEEDASLGTSTILNHYRVDGAVVTEPTALQICVAHKGFCWLEVETFGRAAHGSRYQDGVDANIRMGRVLVALEQLDRRLRERPPHPLVGPPSMHAAQLHGGTGPSTYAAHCRLVIERRTIPGENAVHVLEEIGEMLGRLSGDDADFRAALRSLLVRDPFEVSPSSQIVPTITRVSTAVLGHSPRFIGESYWMDSALLAEAGIDTVIMGPVGAGAHADEEWVDVESVVTLAGILGRTAIDYCS
jgi:acetylornithine deacetylase